MFRLPALLVLLVLFGAVDGASAREPEFSYMTLNGITQVATVAEDIPTDLIALGLKPALFEDRARLALETAGIKVVPLADALTAPGAGKLRIRLITNRDGYGIYYFGVKLELRQKIPLGNPAGGFVSQAVWSDGESGQMLASEFDKPLSALDRLLVRLIADHRAQNGAAD